MEITINGDRIDSQDAQVAITREGYDFSDLRKRFLGRTNRFSLPRTVINNVAFEAPKQIASSGRGFEQFYTTKVIDQGVNLLTGVSFLEEASDSFKIQVVDAAKSFFDSLNLSIRRLNVEDSDFIWDELGLTSFEALTIPNDTVWRWAIEAQSDFPINTLNRPYFQVKEIIDRIFEEKGWSFDNSAGSTKLDNAIISSNHEQFFFTSYQKTINFSEFVGGLFSPTLVLSDNDFEKDVTTTASTITIPGIKTRFRLRGNVIADGDFEIKINGVSKPLGEDQKTNSFFIRPTDTYIDFTTADFETEEAGGNEITISIEAVDTGGILTFDNVYFYSVIEEMDFVFTDIGENPWDLYLVKAYDNMPNINQLDFLREMWALFAIGLKVNSIKKEITSYSYSEISRTNSLDWSDKFIKDSDKVSLLTRSLAQTNFLIYDNDESLPFTEGSSFFNIDNDTLSSSTIYFSSIFGASTDKQEGSNQISTMIVYDTSGRIRTANPRIKLVRAKGLTGYSYFKDIISESLTGLDWLRLIENYNVIFHSINKNRQIEAQFNLDKLDVVGFEFAKVIYIEQKASYFIVLSISNYIPGRATICKLLKLD